MGDSVRVDRDAGLLVATRKVRKPGSSYLLTLPPEIVDGAGFEVGEDVDEAATLNAGEITVRPTEAADPESDQVRVDADGGGLEATRKIRKPGSSILLTLSPQVLNAAGFEEGDRVQLAADIDGGDITISLPDAAEDSEE